MTNLHARVAALERRRERRGGGQQCSPEVEDALRRLKREARIREGGTRGLRALLEATGHPGMDSRAFFALTPAEGLELFDRAPAEGTALAKAYERLRAFEEQRRRQDRTGRRAAEAPAG